MYNFVLKQLTWLTKVQF